MSDALEDRLEAGCIHCRLRFPYDPNDPVSVGRVVVLLKAHDLVCPDHPLRIHQAKLLRLSQDLVSFIEGFGTESLESFQLRLQELESGAGPATPQDGLHAVDGWVVFDRIRAVPQFKTFSNNRDEVETDARTFPAGIYEVRRARLVALQAAGKVASDGPHAGAGGSGDHPSSGFAGGETT